MTEPWKSRKNELESYSTHDAVNFGDNHSMAKWQTKKKEFVINLDRKTLKEYTAFKFQILDSHFFVVNQIRHMILLQ